MALGSSQVRPPSANRLRLAVTGSPDLDRNGGTVLSEQLGNKTLYLWPRQRTSSGISAVGLQVQWPVE
eukprot:1653695-Rhodomonas_salina.1